MLWRQRQGGNRTCFFWRLPGRIYLLAFFSFRRLLELWPGAFSVFKKKHLFLSSLWTSALPLFSTSVIAFILQITWIIYLKISHLIISTTPFLLLKQHILNCYELGCGYVSTISSFQRHKVHLKLTTTSLHLQSPVRLPNIFPSADPYFSTTWISQQASFYFYQVILEIMSIWHLRKSKLLYFLIYHENHAQRYSPRLSQQMSAGMGVKDEYLLWLELQSCHPVGWLCFISGNTLPLFPSQKHSVFKSISYKLCISSLSPSSRTLTSLPSLPYWFRLHLYLILYKFKTTKYYFQNSPYFLIVSSNIWPLHSFHKKLVSPWLPTSWLMQKIFFHISQHLC